MAHYKISDIAKEISERENNPSSSGYDRFVGLEHYVSGDVEIKNFSGTEKLESAMKVFRNGDVLVARRNVYLRRAGIVHFDGITSGDSIVLRANDSNVGRILPFVLNTEKFWEYASQNADGTMSKRLSPKLLLQFEFDVSEGEQLEKDLDLLWKLTETRNAYKEMIEVSEQLIQSRFIKMFGDPIDNPMGWKIEKLKLLSDKITNGSTPKGGSAVYSETGVLFLRSQNVWRNRIDMADAVYLSPELHASMKDSSLKNGDLLITKTGRVNTENSSLGRAALYTGPDDGANINGHVYLIRLLPEYSREFVLSILTSDSYREYIRKICVGGIDKRQINRSHVEDFPIILPPTELQDEYVSFADEVRTSISSLKEAQDHLEHVYQDVLQELIK